MKWGILATGTIAKKFASTVEQMGAEGEQLVAVGSRHMESAQAFAQQYGIPRCYDSYEALAADPEVEAIYIATPNTLHYENCKLCLEQGKHVLCEKPFTISPEQAQQLYRLAEEKHLFLMEAFWTWLLPLLAALWLCHCTRVRGKTPRGCWPLVAAACMVRCMCGFEFITTFLILCEIPLCYAAAKAYFVRRDPHGALVWLGRTVGAGVSALGGVTAALALWFAQEWLCFGSAADAWQNMTRAVTDRVSLTDGAVRDVNVPQVLAQYFRESTEPLLQLGPVSVTAWQLLLLALLVGAVCVVVCLRRGTAAQLVPPCIVWGLGLAAPASWMVLSKAHAAIHAHLVPMLWHFAFVPISCMLLPVLAKLMIPGRKKDLVASH